MSRPQRRVRVIAAIAFTLSFPPIVDAQSRTDVVTLANGDRITGEIVRLERGRLEFKTDDAGTLNLEWDKLTSIVTKRLVEVATGDGRTFLGTLTQSAPRSIAVAATTATVTLPMSDVRMMTTIGRRFWSRVDGSLDAGFSYTKSSGIAQLNFNSSTEYRTPGSQFRLVASLTQTETDDGAGDDDRGAVEVSFGRYPWPRWFILAVGRIDTNESLGLVLRSQIAGAAGPLLVNSNRAQMSAAAGIAFNEEQGVDVEATQNLEAMFLFRSSFYTYDRPRTNLDVSVQYYPSLSNIGRQRLQVDAGVKREVWKDLFLSLNAYDTLDNRPPNPDAERNDVGVVFSFGWAY